MKFLILSDTHIVAPHDTSRGLDTGDRLRRAIADINTNHADATFCIVMGDLVDNGQHQSYVHLRDLLSALQVPWRLMLGNHDERTAFREVFHDAPVDDGGFVQSVLDTEAGRMIFLDTLETGADYGVLCTQRLAWLQARLAEATTQPVWGFLHHPPCNIGMPVDRVKLREPEALLQTLKGHPNVRYLFAGHTHHPAAVMWQGYPCQVVGGTHYSTTLPLNSTAGVTGRYYGPAYYTVVLVEEQQVMVHQHDFLYGYPELARSLFH